MRRMSLVSIGCWFFLMAAPAAAQEQFQPDKSAEFFFYRCAGCHTVGGGKLSGPDLINATQWAEADLKTAVKKMEKNTGALPEPDIAMLTVFLKDKNVASRITLQKQKIIAELRAKMPPPSYEKGRALFLGRQAFFNNGPACVNCHFYVRQGGSLGLELSKVNSKMTGVVLQSAIENANYKVMRAIYQDRKITTEESLHLAEYLSHPEKENASKEMNEDDTVIVAWGGVGVFMALLWLINLKRKGPTRKNLLRKSMGGHGG